MNKAFVLIQLNVALAAWMMSAPSGYCFYSSGDPSPGSTALAEPATSADPCRSKYAPSGESIRATGPVAKANPLRFSINFQDDETDLLYYGYRYYNASTGRWISRDPIEERGGNNLYRFVRNEPVKKYDAFGKVDDDSATACCDEKKRQEGWSILNRRFQNAAQYLHDHGVQLDPDDVDGVSCAQSANRILAFMSPIPPCWTCYVQRRSWNWNPYAGDENSILCKPNKSCHWYSWKPPFSFPVVYDWWWQEYRNARYYGVYPLSVYVGSFPYDLGPPLYAWWTKDNPAPHDDCVKKSTWGKPEDYVKWLDPLLPKK